MVTVCIGPDNSRSLIFTVYRPPNTSILKTRKLINYLQNLSRKADSFILVRDFNLPNINWLNPSMTTLDGFNNIFQACTDEMGLYQCVEQPTYGENILDLAFENHLANVITCNVLPPIATSYHSEVSLLVNAICQKSSKSLFYKVSNKANLSIVSSILCGIN